MTRFRGEENETRRLSVNLPLRRTAAAIKTSRSFSAKQSRQFQVSQALPYCRPRHGEDNDPEAAPGGSPVRVGVGGERGQRWGE